MTSHNVAKRGRVQHISYRPQHRSLGHAASPYCTMLPPSRWLLAYDSQGRTWTSTGLFRYYQSDRRVSAEDSCDYLAKDCRQVKEKKNKRGLIVNRRNNVIMNFHKRCSSAMEGFVGWLQAFFSDHYPLSNYRVDAKSLWILEIYFNMGLKLAFTSWLRNSFFSLGLIVASLRCAGTVAVSIDICISQALCLSLQIWWFDFSFWKADS